MAGFGDQKERKKKRPQQKQQISGDSLLKNAINHHIQGDLKNAEKDYRAAIDSGLLNVSLFSNLGIICQTSQRTAEAISLYKKAIQINSNHPDAYTNLGGLYKDLGNLDQALASTLKSLELKPDNPDALINLGSIHKKLGQLDQALASTLKSLELKPDNPTAHMNLGGIYKDLGKLDQALASTLKSLELKPDNPTAHMNLGTIYLALRLYKNALTATLKSIKIQPNIPTIYVNLSEIYKKLNDMPKAIESINYAIKLDPQSPNAHMLNGLICMEIGNSAKAEQSFLESIRLNDRLPLSHAYLSIIHYTNGDYSASIKSIENAISIDANCTTSKEVETILRANIKSAKPEPSIGSKHESTRNQCLQFPVTLKRPVEEGLIKSLYELEYLDLKKRNLPTKGNAKTSNFFFFEENKQLMHFVEQDLISLAKDAIGTDVHILESWFTILSGDGYVDKHNHNSQLSKIKGFGDQIKKYALVYYLDIGDQSSQEPGHLKFYDPEDLILPSEGMVIIFPAGRFHSVRYSGSKDRVIIGVNFLSV